MCWPLEFDYSWVTVDINVHNWGRGKSWVSEAVIYHASALKEFYQSINRKAERAEEPFRNIFVLQHGQERNFIVMANFAANYKFIDVNHELTF